MPLPSEWGECAVVVPPTYNVWAIVVRHGGVAIRDRLRGLQDDAGCNYKLIQGNSPPASPEFMIVPDRDSEVRDSVRNGKGKGM